MKQNEDTDRLARVKQTVARAEQTVAEALAMKDQLVADFAARKAARLTDPTNAAIWRALYQEPEPTPKRTRKHMPTLARVAKQAAKAGIPVARYDRRPDGTISIVPGKPPETTMTTDNNDSNSNEWDGVLT